jgi:large subunit ribosomal protein L32
MNLAMANQCYRLLEKIMAVQKSRRTPSTRGARRAHDKLKGPSLSVDPTSGETHLRHRVSADGFYRGVQVVAKPEEDDDDE